MAPHPLWTPSATQVAGANLTRFVSELAEQGPFADYDELYAWSISEPDAFWSAMWRFAGIVASRAPTGVLADRRMRATALGPTGSGPEVWFPGSRLNFAENLLRYRDDRTAVLEVSEAGGVRRVSYAQLRSLVGSFAGWLRSRGIGVGDRVAAFMPNRLEAVVAMLATTSVGAIWSSCSPDFGFKGVMDRFGQIGPKVLVACDGYRYNGRDVDCRDRIAQVAEGIEAIRHLVVVDVLGLPVSGERTLRWEDAQDPGSLLTFAQLPFGHPAYIMYSSGTTGVPKCIVHGAGGTLLQHAKEHILHCDLRRDDVLFYYTTCGWMMWNWLVGGLFVGATVVLFDGSPAPPRAEGRDDALLWRLAEELGITHFGTSPKYIGMCRKVGLTPGRSHDLSRLRSVMSTGSPLSAELFRWVYAEVKGDLDLASISGGTDIISCFMLGSPISPVFPGEIQKRGLGMRVEAWNDEGEPVIGEKAELVCTAPFPSMPVGFWNDPDGSTYHRAYFAHFPGVWRHGDYVEITERGGVIVYGRSDATLNPGGVRIGTAEIYRQVESLDEVVESVVVGQRWHDDTRVVLFVVLAGGLQLDDELRARIRSRVRTHTTPRHVPEVILQVPAVPRTISGKKVEIAVTRAIHGEDVTNRDAMANPEALDAYLGRPELAQETR